VRERCTQPILYWFTQPWATSISQNNHWVPLVITHKLQFTQPQRSNLETTRTTHPLCKHTPLVRTPSDTLWLYRISTHLQVYERTNTRIMKGTNYTWVYRNQKACMIRPWTTCTVIQQSCKLLKKLLSKPISISLYLISNFFVLF